MTESLETLRVRFIHADGDRVDDSGQIRRCFPLPDQVRQADGVDADGFAIGRLDEPGDLQQFIQPLGGLSISAEMTSS